MTEDDSKTPPTRAQRRFLSQSITSLYVAIDDLHSDMATAGEVGVETRQALMSELATVVVQLRQWRDEDQIDWQDATPFDGGPEDLLSALLEGGVEERTPQGRRDAAPEAVAKPAEIPTMTLYQSALDICDIVKQLGLTAPIDKPDQKIEAEI